MSTSRCFRGFQYRASRAQKRATKVITQGVCGAVIGGVIGETLLRVHGQEPMRKLVDSAPIKNITAPSNSTGTGYDFFRPHLPTQGPISDIIAIIMILLILYFLISALFEGAKSARDAVDADPVTYLRVTPTVLGAVIGMIKGYMEDIPDLGEEPIVPERSLSHAGRF